MRRIVLLVLTLAILGTLAIPADATSPDTRTPPVLTDESTGFISGGKYMDMPIAQRDAYVEGVIDAIGIVSDDGLTREQSAEQRGASNQPNTFAFSLLSFMGSILDAPTGVLSTQVRAVVDKYLDSHPEEWHNSAALLVWRALTEADWK